MLKNWLSKTLNRSPKAPMGKNATGYRTAPWSIGIYQGSSLSTLAPAPQIDNPVLVASDVNDRVAGLVADPFMIRDDRGRWFMFFEVETLKADRPIGEIGLATSEDGLKWRYQRIVLHEPFHLSYPYVFRWKQDYFMVPETRAARQVRLYRAIDFPMRWRLEKILLKGKRFADSSLIHNQARWWMFTDSGNTTLRLFFSRNLTDTWQEHPQSPLIKKDPMLARPGGRVIATQEGLFRFAQDDLQGYGQRVWGFEIMAMDEKTYLEKRLDRPIIAATGNGWNAVGMHTLDPHQLEDGRWIACVDGCAGDRTP